MYVPRAMYSLRMSFWVVPPIAGPRHALGLGRRDVQRQQDRRRGVDRHRGADLAERQAVEQDRHVGQARDRHPDPADLALRLGRVRVVAHLGRQVEGDRQPGLALLEEVAEAPVGLLGGREAGVLAHRPEPAAVHRRLDATGERVLPGPPEVAILVEAGRVGRGVEVADDDPRRGLERVAPLRGGRQRPSPGGSPASGRGPDRAPPRSDATDGSRVGHRITTSGSPSSTVWPTETSTRSTIPSRGARSSFSIFIASTARSRWPAVTASPGRHRHRHDASRDDGTNVRRAVVGRRRSAGRRPLPQVGVAGVLDLDLEPPAGHDDLDRDAAAGRGPAGARAGRGGARRAGCRSRPVRRPGRSPR